MIIIHKKRLSFIFLVVGISMMTYAMNLKYPKVEETISLPVTNKIVVLDAGHGYPDEGAESINGISEQKINLMITGKVQNLLEQSGCTVIVTRSDENGIYDATAKTIKEKKVSDIQNRVKIGNESSADIFVSIHLNKIPQSQYYGWQTFYRKNDESSEMLAKIIQQELNSSIQRENKREALPISGKYIVEHIEIPITIVECGFLSNPQEEQLLQQDAYQNQIAWGIYNGIMDYFYV